MKKLYILSVFIYAVAFADAQPTLNAANTSPVIGMTFDRKTFTPVTGQEGSGGANQTWDWSTTVEDMSAECNFISPVGTLYADV